MHFSLAARLRLLVCLSAIAAVGLSAGGAFACAARSDDQAPRTERESRTTTEKKIDSQLLIEIYRARGIAAEKGVPPGPTAVRVDAERRAHVDVRAEPTPDLLKKLNDLGAKVTFTSTKDRSIIAWIPLLKLEELAGTSSVASIQPAPQAIR